MSQANTVSPDLLLEYAGVGAFCLRLAQTGAGGMPDGKRLEMRTPSVRSDRDDNRVNVASGPFVTVHAAQRT